MITSGGGFEVPITLKQLESAQFLKDNNTAKVGSEQERVLDGFGKILKKHLEETNELQMQAEQSKKVFATGGNVSLHEVMVQGAKAELSMQLTLQLRNKLLTAYKEIKSMQV